MAKAQKAVVTLVITMVESPNIKVKKKEIKDLVEEGLGSYRTDLINTVKVRNVDID